MCYFWSNILTSFCDCLPRQGKIARPATAFSRTASLFQSSFIIVPMYNRIWKKPSIIKLQLISYMHHTHKCSILVLGILIQWLDTGLLIVPWFSFMSCLIYTSHGELSHPFSYIRLYSRTIPSTPCMGSSQSPHIQPQSRLGCLGHMTVGSVTVIPTP